VTPESRLELLDALMAFETPAHLFGGVAEDALLFGSWVRPHDDVDLLVHRPDLDRALAEAGALGFEEFEVRFEPLPDTPLVLGCILNGHNLEISVHDRTPEGRVFYYMVGAAGRVVRVFLTDGVFDHPPTAIDGVQVRTVSPLAQYQIRAGIAATGAFGPLRPKDLTAQQALRERFFPGIDPDELEPSIEPL